MTAMGCNNSSSREVLDTMPIKQQGFTPAPCRSPRAVAPGTLQQPAHCTAATPHPLQYRQYRRERGSTISHKRALQPEDYQTTSRIGSGSQSKVQNRTAASGQGHIATNARPSKANHINNLGRIHATMCMHAPMQIGRQQPRLAHTPVSHVGWVARKSASWERPPDRLAPPTGTTTQPGSPDATSSACVRTCSRVVTQFGSQTEHACS